MKLRNFCCLCVMGIVLHFLFTSSTAILAQELVTRNDFVCEDSTYELESTNWPAVAIDSSGRLSVIYYAYNSDIDLFVNQYLRLDKFGYQTQPVMHFLPDTVSQDTIFVVNCLSRVYCNNAGMSFIPYSTISRLTDPYATKIPFLMIDENGQPTGTPSTAACYGTDRPNFYDDIPYGAINNENVVGAAWEISGTGPDYSDSILVRLYYPASDSFSPFINPTSLPHPLTDDPEWDGSVHWRGPPAIGIADDGGFAVTWISRDHPIYHVFYIVYNSDYTPRSEVMMADCDMGYFDTSFCVTENVSQLDMAMEADGDFYIIWNEAKLNNPDYNTRKQIWMRGFNSDGSPKYDGVHINDADSLNMQLGQLIFPAIACDDNGNVLVLWSDGRNFVEENGNGSETLDLFAQKIDPDGNLVGPNYLINDIRGTADIYSAASNCDINNAGQAVIVWIDWIWSPGAIPHEVLCQLMPYHDIGTFVPGDVNLDLQHDIADLIYIVDYMFGGSNVRFWPRDLPNVNGDANSLDIADLVYLVDYMFLGGPEPVTPYDGIRPPL